MKEGILEAVMGCNMVDLLLEMAKEDKEFRNRLRRILERMPNDPEIQEACSGNGERSITQ